jgi:hypothetical protein
MVDIVITANASDNGNNVTLSAQISSNETPEGGKDDLSPDWTEPVINQATGIITFQLRAERSGRGDGRVYTISITAVDGSGNSSCVIVKIIVPHDKGNCYDKKDDKEPHDHDKKSHDNEWKSSGYDGKKTPDAGWKK